jgi:hypothetical protein
LARDPNLDKLLLEPDYNADVVTVYTDLAKRYLATQGPLILSWAGRNNQRFQELPSWVPDWTIKNIELPSVIYRAAGDTKSGYKLEHRDGKDVLLVSGLVISTIAHLSEIQRCLPTMVSSMTWRSSGGSEQISRNVTN